MPKKILLIFILIFSFAQATLAKSIPVKVTAVSKISTAGSELNPGDVLKLVTTDNVYMDSKLYLKSGTPVYGDITELVSNGFTCKEASIYAENFWTTNINGETVYLKGIVYKKGNTHWMLTQFLPIVYIFIRGGEAQILPEKDSFILYLESNIYENEN